MHLVLDVVLALGTQGVEENDGQLCPITTENDPTRPLAKRILPNGNDTVGNDD